MLPDKEMKLPEDLKNMSRGELEELAKEIRERLVDVVAKNGGHLASNLGVVELTLAMYSFYNPYIDRIVWDVGHQTYVHKILTGRNAAMDTIRQYEGLSGFPKTEESCADSFNTGHSSTSISAALGMARAKQMTGADYKVCAVIGDGALTGGMAFEALNDAAQTFCDMTVILNDNGMSISRNVGGLSKYLGKIRTGKSYTRVKKGVKKVLGSIPWLGKKLVLLIHKLKKSIKLMLIPGEFFEDLGLEYIGVVDGHDIEEIREALEKAEKKKGPVIVHVMTKKGKGYRPAEDNPALFHGISPFDKETGNVTTLSGGSFSEAFAEKLTELAADDDKISAVTAAMPLGTGLEKFEHKYPERFFDVGIAEQHAVTMAAGMSICGTKPVIAVYSTFLQRGYDQLLHDVALQNLPLVIGLDRSGINGQDGETHQGIYDFAYLGHLPNTTVAAPCSIKEMQNMLSMGMKVFEKDSQPDIHGCFVIRYPAKERLTERKGLLSYTELEYGKGAVIYDSANGGFADLCIMSVGAIAEEAVKAAEKLTLNGVSVRVFNARFIKPIDEAGIIQNARNAKCVITVEEAVAFGGFGERAMLICKNNGIDTKLKVIALPDEALPHGKISQIQHMYGLDADGIISAYGEISNEA
ncbi:MAG: 1-deoxy-D-xylulose-5-phosphate synthase [Clostridia bacterium]|nr:1-deoxy-D-xylulose-5-phosphate synthase [Clostridia bacterium]